MVLSLSLIILIGFSLKGIFQKLKLPGLLGILLAGILLGPYLLNLIDPTILSIAPDLRLIALVVILARAGLSLDIKDLKKVGRPAVLLCFVPASFEILGITLLAPPLLGITHLEAALLGTVLGAVSPAVIVPKMIHLMESGYGKSRSIPQMIMAGASVDDVYTIVLFTALMGLSAGQAFNPAVLLEVPISILSAAGAGLLIGWLLVRLFKLLHIRDTVKVLIILGVSFLIYGLEPMIRKLFPFASLLAIMAIGMTIFAFYSILARRIAGKFSKIWVAAELILFALLGSAVDITYLSRAGWSVVLLIFGGLFFRSAGTWLSVSGAKLTNREKLFSVIAYLPKATVQAAIGALPLAAGLPSGQIILTTAVLAILITAPLGAIGIEKTYPRLLKRE